MWKESNKMDERLKFVARLLEGEKMAGFCGEQALSFEASLREENQRYVWTVKNLEDCLREKIANLSKDGLTQRKIAQETGLGLGTVNRKLKEIKDQIAP